MEASDASATEEVEEEGLDGVVAVVGRGDAVEAMLARELGEPLVAKLTGSLFDTHAVGAGNGPGVEVNSEEFDTQLVGEGANKLLVTVAVAGAEVEIAMGNGKTVAGGMHEMGHADRIAAAADGEQHLPLGREQVLLSDVCLQP